MDRERIGKGERKCGVSALLGSSCQNIATYKCTMVYRPGSKAVVFCCDQHAKEHGKRWTKELIVREVER